jgi:hypothetical protein
LSIQLPSDRFWTVAIDEQEMDLLANPVDVIQRVAPTQMESGLCLMLGRWVNSDDFGRPPYGPPIDGPTEWIPQTPAADPSEASAPPLPPCDMPTQDPAYNC